MQTLVVGLSSLGVGSDLQGQHLPALDLIAATCIRCRASAWRGLCGAGYVVIVLL